MLGLFRPRCPLDAREKAWIEFAVGRLADRFGVRRILDSRVALPTGEHFDLPFSGTADEVEKLFTRVCDHLGVAEPRPRVRVFDDAEDRDAAEIATRNVLRPAGGAPVLYEYDKDQEAHTSGRDRDVVIHVGESITHDLELLIAIFASELCRFQYRQTLTESDDDVELSDTLVELMSACSGFGIFAANAVLREQASTALLSHSWSLRSQGALQARHIGYALALFAWIRGEEKPPWQRHLRLDASATMKSGLKYLRKTNDALFLPDEVRDYSKVSASELLADMRTGSDGRRVAALWEIRERTPESERTQAVPIAVENLTHDNAIVRCEAASTLDQLGEISKSAAPRLVQALGDVSVQVRSAAAYALGNLRADPEAVVPDLVGSLQDKSLRVANAAAWAVERYGEDAVAAGEPLVKLLKRGLVYCEYEVIRQSLAALNAVTESPEAVIQDKLVTQDAELGQRALESLHEWKMDRERAASS